MYIAITCNRSGENLLLRRLAPTESINPRDHVKRWAESAGVKIADSDGHIPRGCADFYAETRERKEAGAVCWDSFDFYLETE